MAFGFYAGTVYQKGNDSAAILQTMPAFTPHYDSATGTQQTTTPSAAEQATDTITSTATSSVPTGPAVIIVTSLPVEGQRLCRNSNVAFSWEADAAHVDEVRFSVNAPMPVNSILDAPVSYNETGDTGRGSIDWKVGTVSSTGSQTMDFPDGDLYRIHVDALYHGTVVYGVDSGTFAVDTCQG